MFLESLIVCIDFGDFLASTLPCNRPIFDQLTIVTSPEDEYTRQLAQEHDCKLVTTSRHRETNLFNKSKAINDGLEICTEQGWLCLLDADIALPQNFRSEVFSEIDQVFPEAGKGEQTRNTVFGLHRYMCWSRTEWQTYLSTGKHKWSVETPRRRVQAPAGYFQLWCTECRKERYPEAYPDCPSATRRGGGGYHGDLAFSRQFRHYRHLPRPRVIHLGTRSKPRSDWKGRVSPKW